MLLPPHLRRALVLLCAGTGLGSMTASGQVLTTLEISFSNPGARSMGLGGAFAALADDATAAFANPAGLLQITRPEVSLEGRSWSYTTPYTSGGRAAGVPTGRGIDTVGGPLTAAADSDLTSLSFASFVLPRSGWSLAFFQHRLLDFEASQEIQGIFAPGAGVAGTYRGPIERARFDLEIVSRGLAAAFRLGERLSVGLGLVHFDPSGGLTGREYLWDEDTVESYFSEASFREDRRVHTVAGEVEGDDWALSAGVLWRVSERWRLAGTYRQGPGFGVVARVEAGPASPSPSPGSVTIESLPEWRFPDVFGLGVAYRSGNDRWTASFEWDRVEYSVLLKVFESLPGNEDDVLDDGDEVHAGVEYAFLTATPVLSIRFGAWHDPDHRIRNDSQDPFARAELPPGRDELHLAAGLGAAFASFQLDLGIDLSDRSDTASLSVVYSF